MNQAELQDVMAAAPEGLKEAVVQTIRRSLRVLRIPPPMRLSVWAERHFYLSAESSYVEGGWKCWPFQRGMMDVMGHDEVHHVTVRKSARVGYTKMLLACLAYGVEHKRRNQVIYQPTDDDRDEFVTTELEPMLRDVRAMRRVMRNFTRRSKDNTLRVKKFTTGLLHLRGGKAAKNYRRLTVDTVVYDEFSGFDRDIEKEGSPGKLGDKRLEGAVWPKSIAGSTPKLKHNDNTEDREQEADAHMRWHVPCYHCHELHEITWGGKDAAHGLKWTDDNSATVGHLCPHCGGFMTQSQYLEVWHAGVWIERSSGMWLDSGRLHPSEHAGFRTAASLNWRVCELPGARDPATILQPPGHAAMPIWTACAPQATWAALVDEFIAAKRLADRGDMSLLKTFVNTTLGETWEEKGESADDHVLQERAKNELPGYRRGTVPTGSLVLTAGIDVQGNRWEIGTWGWARGMESWAIDHHVIEGNPSDERDWEQLEAYLKRRYVQQWHGGSMGLDAVSIDAGYHSQAVYNFVRQMQLRGTRIHAVRGSSEDHKPIKGVASSQDVTWRGKTYPKGVKLWVMGVDTAKDLLYGQLQISTPGPGYVHFPNDFPREWFEQFTAEQRILVRTSSGTTERWVKRRARNETGDCRNYALHAAYCLGLHTWSDKRWSQQEAAAQPARDLFAPDLPSPLIAAPAAQPAASETSPIATNKSTVWHNHRTNRRNPR
jgi:phage terminase large subunit GpA-like protein